MESRMPPKDSGDRRNVATVNLTTANIGRAQANTSQNSNVGIRSSSNLLGTPSNDTTSVECMEIIPNLKAPEKHGDPQDDEKESSGNGEGEYEGDSQEEFEEIESPRCVNPDYLFYSDTPKTDGSEERQPSAIILTPESKGDSQNKESSVVPIIPEAHSDGCGNSEENPAHRWLQPMIVDPTSAIGDIVSRTADPASVKVSPFNVFAFNANTRRATQSWTVSPTTTNIGGSLTDTNSSERPTDSRPIAQRGNVPRFVNMPRSAAQGLQKPHVRFAGSINAARPNPLDRRINTLAGSSNLRRNRLETTATSTPTRPTTTPIVTASVHVNLDLAPHLQSLLRRSNRVRAELTSRVHAQERLADLRWRASDTMYNLGHQLDVVSDLTRRLHRQQREIRESEDLAWETAARKRGRKQGE